MRRSGARPESRRAIISGDSGKFFKTFSAGWSAVLASLKDEGWAAEITCPAAPVQLEGHLPSGEAFYFRARHDEVSLGIGGADPVDEAAWQGSIAHPEASWLPPDDGADILRQLWARYRAAISQRAYLYLERDHDSAGPPYDDNDLERMTFDPDKVTSLIGLTPTSAWRRGDPAPWPGGLPRQFSGWEYELPEARTFDTEHVVTALLDAIEPHAPGIARACSSLGMRAGVMVVISMRGERQADGDAVVSTPDISYRAQTMQRLASLNLAVHHDQYVELPDS